jgi:hypothetical protein
MSFYGLRNSFKEVKGNSPPTLGSFILIQYKDTKTFSTENYYHSGQSPTYSNESVEVTYQFYCETEAELLAFLNKMNSTDKANFLKSLSIFKVEKQLVPQIQVTIGI